MGIDTFLTVESPTGPSAGFTEITESFVPLTPVQKCINSFAGNLRYKYREYMAEFFSTFILLVLGLGVVHVVMLSPNKQNFFSVNWGWGLALTMAIYTNVGISGAHLNPAVTIALAISRGFPWAKVPGYIFAQTLGAFCASALIFGLYYQPLNTFDGGIRQVVGYKASANFYAAYPEPFISQGNAFFNEFVLTAILMIVILSITDHRNASYAALGPIVIGLMLVCIGITLGGLNGYSLNPARDFGPRLFTLVAGWGVETFSAFDYYFWIPMVAPIVGAVFGAILYDFFYLFETTHTLSESVRKYNSS
ncbi:glycerol channel [Basidiobolus ranarum]|uniref:Glycerol channel n=1 Tax=Basidiobolus ranarum TaxID=34480 RepID=A0ABR2VSK7_9FUNG